MASKRFKGIQISSPAFYMDAALGVWGLTAAPTAHAITITQNTAGAVLSNASFFPGNSLTTPSGGPWDNITFNWFSNAPGTTPSAFGALFILTQQYLGTPSNLGAATPGFLGQSQSIATGLYIFDPALQLQSSTRYFFYTNASAFISGNSDAAGENFYFASTSTSSFTGNPADANYRLSGNVVSAVPEPSTWVLFLTSFALALGVSGWNTRQKSLRRSQ